LVVTSANRLWERHSGRPNQDRSKSRCSREFSQEEFHE
jgi:hypothetical protein